MPLAEFEEEEAPGPPEKKRLYIARFLIQQLLSWRAKGILAEILVKVIIQSVAEPDDLSETDLEGPSTSTIANARYKTWSRR